MPWFGVAHYRNLTLIGAAIAAGLALLAQGTASAVIRASAPVFTFAAVYLAARAGVSLPNASTMPK